MVKDTCDIADVVGPYTWRILHHIVGAFPCTQCADHGGKLMRFMHDLVNLKTAKPLHDAPNFRHMLAEALDLGAKAGQRQDARVKSMNDLEREVTKLAGETQLSAKNGQTNDSRDALKGEVLSLLEGSCVSASREQKNLPVAWQCSPKARGCPISSKGVIN